MIGRMIRLLVIVIIMGVIGIAVYRAESNGNLGVRRVYRAAGSVGNRAAGVARDFRMRVRPVVTGSTLKNLKDPNASDTESDNGQETGPAPTEPLEEEVVLGDPIIGAKLDAAIGAIRASGPTAGSSVVEDLAGAVDRSPTVVYNMLLIAMESSYDAYKEKYAFNDLAMEIYVHKEAIRALILEYPD